VKKHHRSVRDLFSSLKTLLLSKRAGKSDGLLEQVVQQLHEGRGYFGIGIYLAAGDKLVRQAFRGAFPPCYSLALELANVGTAGQITKVIPDVSSDPTYSLCFREAKSAIVRPIKVGTRVLGMIDVQSESLNAFSSQERALLEQVSRMLARHLTTNEGKRLLRKAREQSHIAPTEPQAHKQPQSARPALRRAAAGEHSTR
jgi:L-methionine (R)-S-oxide reductase